MFNLPCKHFLLTFLFFFIYQNFLSLAKSGSLPLNDVPATQLMFQRERPTLFFDTTPYPRPWDLSSAGGLKSGSHQSPALWDGRAQIFICAVKCLFMIIDNAPSVRNWPCTGAHA